MGNGTMLRFLQRYLCRYRTPHVRIRKRCEGLPHLFLIALTYATFCGGCEVSTTKHAFLW